MAEGRGKRKKPEAEEETKRQFTWTWNQVDDDLIYGEGGAKGSKLIASFDMDSTLIETKSGATFAKNISDWKLWNDGIPAKLKEYADKGYTIVIISNQAGVGEDKVTAADIKKKFANVVEALGVPCKVLMAISKRSPYRKPAPNAWEFFVKKMNDGIAVDMKESFYCGDAAGRPPDKSANRPKKDFSDSDYKFALNIGLPFKTPDQFFLASKEVVPPVTDPFPRCVPKFSDTGSIFTDGSKDVASKDKEIVIAIGSAGSGKSTIYHKYLKPAGYSHVNRDTLGTKPKCFAATESACAAGKSVYIDNMNTSLDDRQEFIAIAKKHGYTKIRAFYFDYPKDYVFHLNKLRGANVHREQYTKPVSDVVIHTWYKNHVPPTTKEGFTEIKVLKPTAGPFVNQEDEKLFFSYLDA